MSILSFNQAIQSPCSNCSAPCCTYLPLHDFVIQHLDHLDYALYLLNFANIELALVNGTTWRVHYAQRCSRLADNGTCRLHGQPNKPMVCQNYSATTCFYKSMFINPETDAFVRFDYHRMLAYAEMMSFDENRNVVSQPQIQGLVDCLPPFKVEPVFEIPSPRTIQSISHVRFMEFHNPCNNCSAWCCSTLSFPFSEIQSRANLDYLWFCLGFPNVELNIGADQWSIVVKTHCRYLERSTIGNGRCKLFGKSERPMQCQSYDATQCGYKQRHLPSSSTTFATVDLENFAIFADQYLFDDVGQLVHSPSMREVLDCMSE